MRGSSVKDLVDRIFFSLIKYNPKWCSANLKILERSRSTLAYSNMNKGDSGRCVAPYTWSGFQSLLNYYTGKIPEWKILHVRSSPKTKWSTKKYLWGKYSKKKIELRINSEVPCLINSTEQLKIINITEQLKRWLSCNCWPSCSWECEGFNMKEIMWHFHTLLGTGSDSDNCLELQILISSHWFLLFHQSKTNVNS